jgi:hypothetical protein
MRFSILIFIAACGRQPPAQVATPVARAPADAAVFTREEDAAAPECVAIDPKRIHTQVGAFVLVEDSSAVVVYRQGASCATEVGDIHVGGSFAFAELLAKPNADDVPDVSLDTWLMHGDRLRREYVWDGTHYTQHGVERDIPGPGKWRPHKP